jgi:hypothetical protein
MTAEISWCFTYFPFIVQILKEGSLVPQVTALPDAAPAMFKRENPAVWFSANQEWELSSNKPYPQNQIGDDVLSPWAVVGRLDNKI